MKKKSNSAKLSEKAVETQPEKPKAIAVFLLKAALIAAAILFVIYYIEKKNYFYLTDKNNHTEKKWDSFYQFTEVQNVDVLLVGNSHLYTGINPKHLSASLGCNAFILASPGTHIGDLYWALKEAIERTKPSVVVIETYGINETEPYNLSESQLSDQIKSFYSRKNTMVKLASTPELFSLGDSPYAWSAFLRNHNYIFTSTEEIRQNLKRNEKEEDYLKKLYLGRYVRFTSGITDSNLSKYDELGPVVDGSDFEVSETAKIYVEKIKTLCEEQGIELVFLTLPMYEKHITNYDSIQSTLSPFLSSSHWLDLQDSINYTDLKFGPNAFENTLQANQHMTYNGSIIATYALSRYLKNDLKLELPQRDSTEEWHNLFAGEEGYFEHYKFHPNDKKVQLIKKDFQTNNVYVNEILLSQNNDKNKTQKILFKIKKTENLDTLINKIKLRTVLQVDFEEKIQNTTIDLIPLTYLQDDDELVFVRDLKPLEVKECLGAALMNR